MLRLESRHQVHRKESERKARAVFPRVIGFGGYNNDETTLTLQEEDEEDIDAFISTPRRLAAGTPLVRTCNCNENTSKSQCTLVSNSSDLIATDDLAINSAHNCAIATCDCCHQQFGRDSIDGQGKLRSLGLSSWQRLTGIAGITMRRTAWQLLVVSNRRALMVASHGSDCLQSGSHEEPALFETL
jgi:hypothetical protein